MNYIILLSTGKFFCMGRHYAFTWCIHSNAVFSVKWSCCFV